MCDIEPLEWHSLYGNDQKFKKYLSPETNAHPAKMSMRLADKIITHLEQLDLLRNGDRIVGKFCSMCFLCLAKSCLSVT